MASTLSEGKGSTSENLRRSKVILDKAEASLKQDMDFKTTTPPLGFGCMGMAAFYGAPISEEASVALLRGVYDAGCRHFDTAEVYKSGEFGVFQETDVFNEVQVGNFLKTVKRDTFTVATKFFPMLHADCKYENVKAALVKSLERLQLDFVDLYYLHRIPSLEAAKDFTESCKKLKEEGLLQNIGMSEINGKWLRQCHEISPIAAIQQEWSLLTRNFVEDDLAPVCAELGIVVVAYSPLARNLLANAPTETPKDWRATNMRYSEENLKKNRDLVAHVKKIAGESTTAQLSLAWIFHKAKELGVVVVPIPGTTKLQHALSNIKAVTIDINDDDMRVLEGIAAQVAGERGSEGYGDMAIEAQLKDAK